MKENVIADAQKYSYQSEWANVSGGAFTSAKRNGWFQEACAHMKSPKVPLGHWTVENLIEDAKKHQTRSEWRKTNQSAYVTAKAKGCLQECCAHMIRTRNPDGHWTREHVIESAREYQTIAAWSNAHSGAYDAAKSKGWLDVATEHMVRVFSHGEHTIYSLLLQYNISFIYQKRFDNLRDKYPLPIDFYLPEFNLAIEFHGRQHFEVSKNSIFKEDFANMQRRDEIKRQYARTQDVEYLEIDTPVVEEIEHIIIQKISEIGSLKGIMLTLVKRDLTLDEKRTLSSLGIWTKEAVIADALRYTLLKDWVNCGNAAYQIAGKNGWAEEATAHMARSQKPSRYWTKERVIEDAKKYKSKMEWFKASQSAWATAQRNGWLEECSEHMKPLLSDSK